MGVVGTEVREEAGRGEALRDKGLRGVEGKIQAGLGLAQNGLFFGLNARRSGGIWHKPHGELTGRRGLFSHHVCVGSLQLIGR